MTASTPKTKVLDNFREMVAASATFQALVGAGGTTEAKLRVHEFGATDSQGPPRAIVDHLAYETEVVAVGLRAYRGELLVSFEFDVPSHQDSDIPTAAQWFENQTGAITEEMLNLARTTRSGTSETYLDLRGSAVYELPGVLPPDEEVQGDPGDGRQALRWGVAYSFRWQG